MKSTVCFILAALTVSMAQRSPYAGRRPIGYPSMDATTTTTASPATDSFGNRFGEDVTTTTQRLPIEANGDANLVRRLQKLPVDHQPFWLLNWEAMDRDRTQPKTYSVRQNGFIDFASAPNQAQGGDLNRSGIMNRK